MNYCVRPHNVVSVLSLSLLALTLSACSGTDTKQWKPETARRSHSIAYRQLAPEPVYNRLRWVHPPDNLSEEPKTEVTSSAPVLFPVVHLDLKGTSLEEASRALAATARYSSFCASSVSGRKVTLSKLGTIDELGEALSSAADVQVHVDHEGRAVRIFPKPLPQPEFYGAEAKSAAAPVVPSGVLEEKVANHEYKSTH